MAYQMGNLTELPYQIQQNLVSNHHGHPITIVEPLWNNCQIDIFQELQPALADPGGGAEEDSGDAAEGEPVPVQLKVVVVRRRLQQVQQHSLAVGTHLREQQQQQGARALIIVAFFESFPGDFTLVTGCS